MTALEAERELQKLENRWEKDDVSFDERYSDLLYLVKKMILDGRRQRRNIQNDMFSLW